MNIFKTIKDKFSNLKNSNKYISKIIDFVSSKTFTRAVGITASIVTLGVAVGTSAGGFAVALAAAGLGATIIAAATGLALQVKTLRNFEKLKKINELIRYIDEADIRLGVKKNDNVINTYNNKDKLGSIKSIWKNIVSNFPENITPMVTGVLSMSIPGIISAGFGIIAGLIFGTKERMKIEKNKHQMKTNIENFNNKMGEWDIKNFEELAIEKFKICKLAEIDIEKPNIKTISTLKLIKNLVNPFAKPFDIKNPFIEMHEPKFKEKGNMKKTASFSPINTPYVVSISKAHKRD